MNIGGKLTFYTCVTMLTLAIFGTAVMAGGPPLKANTCGSCHSDYSKIMPQKHPDVGTGKSTPCLTCHPPDPAKNEPTKLSTEVHKVHQGGKTKLECAACHAL